MLTLHHHFSTRIFLSASTKGPVCTTRRTRVRHLLQGPRPCGPGLDKNLRASDLAASWNFDRKGGTHAS